MRCLQFAVVFGAIATLGMTGARAAELGQVASKIDNFSLKSQFGKEYALSDFADKPIVVVAFIGAECPLAKLYGPRLAELAARYRDRGVAFLGIDSNQQDSIQEIAAFGTRHKIEFPLLKDTGNRVADQFQAERTPEVFVLDQGRTIRYRGRIDDQYGFADGVGYQRPAPEHRELAAAIDDLLAKRPVAVASTDTVGCRIGRIRKVNEDSPITYSNQIARIFQSHCVECHRPGRIGPFAMTSYDEVVGWGEMIREVVDQGRMPPWHASPEHGKFRNDMRLTDEEKQQIARWVENGCPEGDRSQLPPPKEFVDGWSIGEPDQIVYMRDEPVQVPAEGVIDYYHFVVDPGWKEDKWIMAAEAKPSSLETVHHILVFVLPPNGGFAGRGGDNNRAASGDDDAKNERGRRFTQRRGRRGGDGQGFGGPRAGGGIGGGNLIAGYAPGMNPLLDTNGETAMRVKAGSKLLFQMHYTPNGSPASDRSYVGFRFADPDQVKYVARSSAVANAWFAIPPHAADYEATADTTFEHDTLLTSMTPHMHTRGKAFRYELTYPDGKKEILLDVPAYDFNWQTSYQLQEPKQIPKGSTLLCTAHWDNSEANLSNPDPDDKVTWGDQTWEEMMIGFYVEVFPKGEVPEQGGAGGAFGRLDPEKIFKSADSNGDGKLSKDELPDRIGERLSLADTDGDGALSKDELMAILRLFSGARRPQQRDPSDEK